MGATTARALDRLLDVLTGSLGPPLIAMSAGVDSCTLAHVAQELHGEGALAVTLSTESTSTEELADARSFAIEHRVRHRVIAHSELADPAYVANRLDRCYHCRRGMAEALWEVARSTGHGWIAMGVVTDDLAEHRPGLQAAREAGIRFPFVEAAIDKRTVRAIARQRGLKVALRPANACLSSRIEPLLPVTRGRLRQIERAERAVRELSGVTLVRVRHHGEHARIEVLPEDRGRVLARAAAVGRALRDLGFDRVGLDLAGYRSGSMVAPYVDASAAPSPASAQAAF